MAEHILIGRMPATEENRRFFEVGTAGVCNEENRRFFEVGTAGACNEENQRLSEYCTVENATERMRCVLSLTRPMEQISMRKVEWYGEHQFIQNH